MNLLFTLRPFPVETCNICEDLNLKIKSSGLEDAAKRVAVVHRQRAKKFYKALGSATQECKEREHLALAVVTNTYTRFILPNSLVFPYFAFTMKV